MDETPYRLAYEASVRAIDDQARVLEDLRSRGSTLIAAAALVTGFLGGEALTRSTSVELWSWTGVALTCFLATASFSFAVLWPVHARLRISARETLALLQQRERESRPVTATEALSELALRLELMCDDNSTRIRRRYALFRGAIVFLSTEVTAWMVALWRL